MGGLILIIIAMDELERRATEAYDIMVGHNSARVFKPGTRKINLEATKRIKKDHLRELEGEYKADIFRLGYEFHLDTSGIIYMTHNGKKWKPKY